MTTLNIPAPVATQERTRRSVSEVELRMLVKADCTPLLTRITAIGVLHGMSENTQEKHGFHAMAVYYTVKLGKTGLEEQDVLDAADILNVAKQNDLNITSIDDVFKGNGKRISSSLGKDVTKSLQNFVGYHARSLMTAMQAAKENSALEMEKSTTHAAEPKGPLSGLKKRLSQMMWSGVKGTGHEKEHAFRTSPSSSRSSSPTPAATRMQYGGF